MALKHGKPNPLNYFDLRRVSFAPPHFKYITLNKYTNDYVSKIDAWIYSNLNSRYFIGQTLELDISNSIVYATKVGFESEKELSFFTIACPHLNLR